MRNIPTVTRNLLIINTLCYLVTVALEMVGIDLTNMFGLHFMLAHNFWFFQLFTYMFMHGGFTHLLFNMFALWMFGCVIEQTWGPAASWPIILRAALVPDCFKRWHSWATFIC